MNQNSYFISDLHLEQNRPEITALFLQLLQSLSHKSNVLYILGDFFESWVGDDDDSIFHTSIIQALSEASNAGLKIYMMHGNRDFLLGEHFMQLTGATLLPDPSVIDLYGHAVLLMHGDSLCTQDKKYLAFRKQSREPAYQAAFLSKPLVERHAIATQLRAASREHTATSADHIMDVTPDEVIRVMKHHQVHHLIHGHTHRPKIHDVQLDTVAANRYVLGAWHDAGSILVWPIQGSVELRSFKTLEAILP